MINCIYKISSTIKSEKIYIGSAINFIKRKDRHKTSLKNNWHANSILQNHYNKYGKDDLVFNILESNIKTEELLNREQFYIDTLKPVFNILKIAGSNLGKKASEETKAKLRKIQQERIYSEEQLNKYKERMLGNTYRNGVKHTDETISKMSIQRKGNKYAKGSIRTQEFKYNLSVKNKGKSFTEEAKIKSLLKISKPVNQFTKEGIFIKEWQSAAKAERELNIKHVGSCCNGKRITAGKFKWNWKNNL